MHIDLTPDQDYLVREGIAAGRYRNREDAVREAIARWEAQERRRVELLSALDEAEASIARGEAEEVTPESARALADVVKQRGRAALATNTPGMR